MKCLFFDREENYDGRGWDAIELRSVMPVNVNTSFDALRPALMMVEREWIKDVLGNGLMEVLAHHYADYGHEGADGTGGRRDVLAELLKLVQMAEVRLALWDSYDQLKVEMNEAGAVPVVEGDRRLYRYEDDALRRSLKLQGFRCLDEVARYCDDHVDVLVEFKESDWYRQLSGSLVKGRLDFDRMVPISKCAVIWQRVRPYVEEAERVELGYRLGEGLSNRIRNYDGKDAAIGRIIDGVRLFVAHYGYAEACRCMNVVPTELGLMLYAELPSSKSGTGMTMNQPKQEQTDRVIEVEKQRAERALSGVMDYIRKHLDLYPEAREIGGEFMPTDDVVRRDNRNKRSFVF